jgi:two-component system sporulation sensor kinase A
MMRQLDLRDVSCSGAVAAEPSNESSSNSPATIKKRVLVVDDDDRILQFLSFFLREDGYEVGVAFDGPEGLQEFQRQSWDLVITDRLMRVMDGVEMTEAIKRINPDVPVILIQGTPDAWTDRELFAAVLAKPFRRQHILDVVRRIVHVTAKIQAA